MVLELQQTAIEKLRMPREVYIKEAKDCLDCGFVTVNKKGVKTGCTLDKFVEFKLRQKDADGQPIPLPPEVGELIRVRKNGRCLLSIAKDTTGHICLYCQAKMVKYRKLSETTFEYKCRKCHATDTTPLPYKEAFLGLCIGFLEMENKKALQLDTDMPVRQPPRYRLVGYWCEDCKCCKGGETHAAIQEEKTMLD